jgi:hypothetical protein
MQLTPTERKRLKTLRGWHQRPPTWAGLLPKFVGLVIVWCVLIIGFAIVVAGVGSPLMYYCLGLVTFFPILALNLIATSVRRWRINEAITNWDRVEELVSGKQKQ